jgi:hypothetical protein
MSMPLDWDPTPVKTKRLPALEVSAPFGVLAFKGARNPQTRSNTAHRISYAFATPATKGIPQIYHFESEAEFAVVLEASLDPDIHEIEVQLPPLRVPWERNKRGYLDHHFDVRLTYKDGYRRALYIKNGTALQSEKTQAEIKAIFSVITSDFADDAFVVNADHYSRAYRDNLRRLHYLSQKANLADDAHVEHAARHSAYWTLDDLIKKCSISPGNAWQAAMRLIAQRVLGTNWHAVISVHSRVWLNA